MQGAACDEGAVKAASPRADISTMGQFFISVFPPESSYQSLASFVAAHALPAAAQPSSPQRAQGIACVSWSVHVSDEAIVAARRWALEGL
jgi:hypothetical protein